MPTHFPPLPAVHTLPPTTLNPYSSHFPISTHAPSCPPALIHTHVHPFLATLRPSTLAYPISFTFHLPFLCHVLLPIPFPSVHSLRSTVLAPHAISRLNENPNKEGFWENFALWMLHLATCTVGAAFDEIGEDDGVWRHHCLPLFEKADCFFHLRALETTPDCTMECQELQICQSMNNVPADSSNEITGVIEVQNLSNTPQRRYVQQASCLTRSDYRVQHAAEGNIRRNQTSQCPNSVPPFPITISKYVKLNGLHFQKEISPKNIPNSKKAAAVDPKQ